LGGEGLDFDGITEFFKALYQALGVRDRAGRRGRQACVLPQAPSQNVLADAIFSP
jgi:hypothetical protein